jgi:pyruvate-formate lyase-activating enzyme
MTGKTFPIRNDTACVYKWGWNTFRLRNGKSSSCHRVVPVAVPLDQFDDFHNTAEVINDRKRMLAGQWPEAGRGCEYCQEVEAQGGISDRLYHNNIPGLTPVDFDPAGDQKVIPRILELYLSNTCDLACIYCLPGHSSRNNEELKKYGPYPVGILPVKEVSNRDQYFAAWLKWLDKNYEHVNTLSILGGEPFLQKEMWDILEFIGERKNSNLTLAINTNLNSNPATVKRFVETYKNLIAARKIKRVHISASLDCWGPRAEFIRSGLDLARWQENFEYLIQHKWLSISVHQVITSLSIDTALELQRRIAEYKKQNPKITQAYHMVDSGFDEIYHPMMFGSQFFKHKLDTLLTQYPVSTDWDIAARSRLEGICKLMDAAQQDPTRLVKLRDTLDMIDHRRNTNWRKLFPEIDQYFIEHRI